MQNMHACAFRELHACADRELHACADRGCSSKLLNKFLEEVNISSSAGTQTRGLVGNIFFRGGNLPPHWSSNLSKRGQQLYIGAHNHQ